MVEISISTDYVNELIYNYLAENGYVHTAFAFKSETGKVFNEKNENNEMSLMRLVHRAKLYEYAAQVSAAIMDRQEETYGGSARLMANLTSEKDIQRLLENVHESVRVKFEKSMYESPERSSNDENQTNKVEVLSTVSDAEVCVLEQKKYTVEFFVKVSCNLLLAICKNDKIYKVEQVNETEFGVIYLGKTDESVTCVEKKIFDVCNGNVSRWCEAIYFGLVSGEVMAMDVRDLRQTKLNFQMANEEAVWMMKVQGNLLNAVSITGDGQVFDFIKNEVIFRYNSNRDAVWDLHWLGPQKFVTADAYSFLNFYDINDNSTEVNVMNDDGHATIIQPMGNIAENLLILGYLDGQIGVYDTNEKRLVSVYGNFHRSEITSIVKVERGEKCYVISMDARISCIKIMKNERENQASNSAVHIFQRISIEPNCGVYAVKYVENMNAIIMCSLMGKNVYSLNCSDDVMKELSENDNSDVSSKITDFEVLSRWNQAAVFVGALELEQRIFFMELKS